jgi:hypothetical protein
MRGKCCVECRREVAVIESIEARQAVETVPFDKRRVEF